MLCLKCGKETAERQVFCYDCLNVMQAYPVKPGTAIHLPRREEPARDRKPARHREPPKDQLSQLRTLIRCLVAAIAVLSVLLCATAAMLLDMLGNDPTPNTIGRNYTTADSGNQP